MSSLRSRLPVFVLLLLGVLPAAHAQFAVIDVAAVTQLVTEVDHLAQAVTVARAHLAEAQAQLRSMTGDRGMERLLAGTDRNYLPTDFGQLAAAMAGTGSGYSALSSDLRQALAADSVLDPRQIAWLAPAARQQLAAYRQGTALLQALSRQGLEHASGRFAALQQLIDAIGTADDQKAILDLNARIDAEQAMLKNERTKLGMLVATAQAQRWAAKDEARERAVAAQGEFATRFQPVP